MKITRNLLRKLISEELNIRLDEETMTQQRNTAINQISNILTRAETAGNLNAQDIINQAKESYEKSKPKPGDEMENEDAIDEDCGDMQSVDMSVDPTHDDEDHEGSMAKRQMFKTAEYATIIFDMLDDDEELPAWIQSKLTKVADYIGAVKHYLEYDEVMGEKLDPDADAGDYVNDFQKSDNKRFKGKSKEKRREMAVAAYLDTKDDK
jgi:hypothetical protein